MPRPQRVLVVDDTLDTLELWRVWLTMCGFHVDVARNGLEGIQHAIGHPPLVILMDLRMPVMDGWEAMRVLQGHPQTKNIPVLCVSADVMPDTAQRAGCGGCVSFLSKPLDPHDLLEDIRRVLRPA